MQSPRGKTHSRSSYVTRTLVAVLLDLDDRVLGREQHVVVEFVGDLLRPLLERDEVEDVVVLLQRPFDLDRGAVVVAVQPLALVPAGS